MQHDRQTVETADTTPRADQTGPTGLAPLWKMAGFALFVMVLLGVVYLSPLRERLSHWQELSRMVRSWGAWAPVTYTLAVAVLVAVGFPRLLFCVIAGATFGFWSGLLWSQLGTLGGTYLVFTLARARSDWARRVVERRIRLTSLVQREGAAGVILVRQLPVPSIIINVACGLLSITHRDFLIGTIIGQLPQAIPCTLIGAGLLRASLAESLGLLSLAIVAAVLLFLGLRRWLSNR